MQALGTMTLALTDPVGFFQQPPRLPRRRKEEKSGPSVAARVRHELAEATDDHRRYMPRLSRYPY